MVILNLVVHKSGLIVSTKSYYCNVAEFKQISESELERIQQEYLNTVRKFTGITEEDISDRNLMDDHGWFYYGGTGVDVTLDYSDETEQINMLC